MPTLELRFPSGHFHATPSWGHHVNEGLIEWPPSPWRLLRALIATGYTKCHWPGSMPPESAVRLLHKLASVLPSYQLPSAGGAHTRHYMPQGSLDKSRGVEGTALVIDAFAHGIDDPLLVHWPIELDAEEHAVLEALAAHLGYLGRAESWTDARLLIQDSPEMTINCQPCSDDTQRNWHRPRFEQISLLASMSEPAFCAWLAAASVTAISATGIDTQAKLTAAQKKKLMLAMAPFPPTLIDALQATTNGLRKHGWSQPPGARKALYWRPQHAIKVSPSTSPVLSTGSAPVECALLSLATVSHNQHALPMRARSLNLCERLHRHLVGIAIKQLGQCPSELTGKDQQRQPLKTPHQHAHIAALDLDGDQRIDHFLIYAPMGLGNVAQEAIRRVRQTYTKGQDAMRLALAANGELHALAQEIDALGPFVRSAKRWLSSTPFVPPRYLKPRGTNTLEGQVRSELALRGFAAPLTVRTIAVASDDEHVAEAQRQRHFNRIRGKLPPKQDAAFTLELVFDRPVAGPIALGYASHFGMGLFVAVSS